MSAVKPTHLGAWRLPTFPARAAAVRKPLDRSHIAALTGLNEDGSFKTAAAKEYAEPLCRCIASSFADAAKAVDDVDYGEGPLFPACGFALPDFLTQIIEADDFGADFVDTGFLPLFQLRGEGIDVRAL